LSLVQTIAFLPSSVGGGGDGDDCSGLDSARRAGDDKQQSGALAQPSLIVDFDDQSKVLLASDIKRTVLYALDLCTHPNLPLEGLAFGSISEFLLTSPCIAFDIGQITRQTFPSATEELEVGVEVSPPRMAENRSLVSPHCEVLLAPEAFVSPANSSSSENSPSQVTSSITKVTELEPSASRSPVLNQTEDMFTYVISLFHVYYQAVLTAVRAPATNFRTKCNPAAGDSITSSLNVSTVDSSDLLLAGESLHPTVTAPIPTPTTGPSGDSEEDHRDVEKALDGVGESLLSNAAAAAATAAVVASSSDSSFSSIPTAKGADSLSGPVSPASVSSPGKQRASMSTNFRSQAASPSQQLRSLKKTFDSTPSFDSMFTNAFQPPGSPNSSEVHSLLGESRIPPMSDSLSYTNRPPPSYLSDSVRSLMGSSSSLESRAFNSRGPPLPSSSSVASVGTGGSCVAPTVPNGNPYTSLSPSLSGVAFNLDELVASINKLVQENKNQLNKVVTTQNALVQKLNEISSLQQERAVSLPSAAAGSAQVALPSSSSISSLSAMMSPSTAVQKPETSDIGVSPQWADLMMEQLRSQKTETTKRLNQLENSLKNLINTQKAASAAATSPSTSTEMNAKHTKMLTEQIRNILKTELQTVFRANTPKMIEPLRQSAVRTIEDAVRNLPSLLADQMMRVLNDPFSVTLATDCDKISSTYRRYCAVAPSVSAAYREELRGVLVPAFNNGIQLLLKDLDVILKTGFQQREQTLKISAE
uniref:UDENN domain-containing protein n=1 Tax=Schistocephalus solidus TaxID=70667 RepID=A0A183T6Z7_SCHSO